MKTLLGVVLEILVAVALAGLILAVVIPFLNSRDLLDAGRTTASVVVIGVLAGAVGLALFRPGSAIHRRLKR